ncbi:MAG: lipopolysaccharide transport periplasmic protein LptA [Gammaproteobacteria bacterium]|nr:lipopolysaccharide transport periplasmic protein LptA [Gammaproteobacteria bacterium]
MPRARLSPVLVLAGALAAGGAFAADPPPLVIEADRAELDERAGVGVYRGNVVAERGPLTLWAAELTIYTQAGGLQRAVAAGQPARFRRAAEDAGQQLPVTGRARTIDYRPAERRVVLNGSAELERGRSRFESERIVYRLDRNRVEAGEGGQRERVRVTIEPEPAGETSGGAGADADGDRP